MVLQAVAPLGRVPRFDGTELHLSDTTARRFILDISRIAKRPKTELLANSRAFDDSYVGIAFSNALNRLIQRDFQVYTKLFGLVEELDALASCWVSSCEQAAVILSHRSFGDRLFPHIHFRSEADLPTLSVFYNLTSAQPSTLRLLDPVFQGDRAFESGYTDHRALLVHERRSTPVEVTVQHDSALLFDASHQPHSYSYSDDLWLTLVYDQARCQNLVLKDRYLCVELPK